MKTLDDLTARKLANALKLVNALYRAAHQEALLEHRPCSDAKLREASDRVDTARSDLIAALIGEETAP